jgi:hypothetical protein
MAPLFEHAPRRNSPKMSANNLKDLDLIARLPFLFCYRRKKPVAENGKVIGHYQDSDYHEKRSSDDINDL